MAQEVQLGGGATGKIRNIIVVFLLSFITLGIYQWFWYYFVNDELKQVGAAKGEEELANSNPTMSIVAFTIGALVIIPPFITAFNYGKRILLAQEAVGVPESNRISPVPTFLLLCPGFLLVFLPLIWWWLVQSNQNKVLRAAAVPPAGNSAAPVPAA